MATGLDTLTKQLNAYKPASVESMSGLQEKLSQEVAKKIAVSEQRIGELSRSMEIQKKSVEDTNKLIKDLMVGLENRSDNLEIIQK